MEKFSYNHSQALMMKHPSHVPIVLVSNEQLQNTKLLMNKETTVSNLMCHIRSKNKLNRFQAYYIFISKLLVSQTSTLGDLHRMYSNENGFLYITVKKENTFG